ncbi:MAG: transglycosylase domain-containing protein [Lachnospira sp.]
MNYGGNGIKQKKKLLNSATSKFGNKLRVFIVKVLLIGAVTIVVSGACLAFGCFQGIVECAPDIENISVAPDGYATKIYDCNGNEIQSLAATGANRISVDINQIPVDLQHAFVAIEDERFYEHNGIDLKGIIRAATVTVKNMELSQGASTITQQLIKNNVFNAYNETTIEKIRRKIQEQYLAVELETVMSKSEILENYLNTINLGNGYYGVQAAANGYFNKDVSELTLSECAVIASITKNPSGLNPLRNPERNRARQLTVLENMKDQGYISQEEYQNAIDDDVYARLEGLDVDESSSSYSYFVDEVIDQLIDDLMTRKGYTETQATNLIYKGGLKVYTTQDMTMQEIAESIVNNPEYYDGDDFSINYSLTIKDADGKNHYFSHITMQNWYRANTELTSFILTFNDVDAANSYVERYSKAMQEDYPGGKVTYENTTFTIQPQVSFSLIEQSTGYVKVLIGGRGDKTSSRSFNRATSSARQPGSSIKPLAVYGPALDTGDYSLASVFDDAPYFYANGKLVQNVHKTYLGYMDMRTAIQQSENIPAVKTLTAITPSYGFSYLEKMKFGSIVSPSNAINGVHDVVQSLALGGMSKGVYNIDMCTGYATLANGGVYNEPLFYTRVEDNSGNVIIDKESSQESFRVYEETTAWLMTSALRSVVTSSTVSTAYDADFEGQTVVGKTGTTQEGVDRWFCGYTPYYTAAIWVGYDDNSTPVNNANHIKMYGKIMEAVHKGLPEGHFTQPSDIVEVEVCSQSGLLPVEGLCDKDPRGSCIKTEYFSEDNVPTEYCNVHVKVTTCNESHSIATAKCPGYTTAIKILKDDLELPEEYSNLTTMDAPYAITRSEYATLCPVHGGTTALKPSISGSNSTTTKPAVPGETEPDSTENDIGLPETTNQGTTSSSSSGSSTSGSTKPGTASTGSSSSSGSSGSSGSNSHDTDDD